MLIPYREMFPRLGNNVFIAPTATVIGDVTIGEGSSVWFGAVVRGDVNYVKIGRNTSIQDGVVVHTASAAVGGTGGERPAILGDSVTVGHNAVIHACVVEDCCLIGMGAVLLDGAVIGRGSVVAAGAVVTGRTVIPPFSVVAGVPAKIVKTLPADSVEQRLSHAEHYARLAAEYL